MLATVAELRFRSGLRMTLIRFAKRPRILPRFSFFSINEGAADDSEGPVRMPRFNGRSGRFNAGGGSEMRLEAVPFVCAPANKSWKGFRVLLSRRGI